MKPTKTTRQEPQPLYVTIAYFGGWTITHKATRHEYGHTTSSLTGYGMDFTAKNLPANIPVIDFRDCENVCKALNIPDAQRPAEAYPYYSGSLETYLQALKSLNITIKTVQDYL